MASIEHLQIVHAPAAKVYEVLTTEQGLSEIWTDELKVKAEVGYINEFQFGENDLTKLRIEELLPERKIVWHCLESGDQEWVGTTISFELEEKKDKTSIILKHINWQEVSDCFRFCNYNWAIFLYSLKLYCEEGKGMPYQNRKL